MFFSSLIAENASRKIRLVFPTPSHVPAPVKEDSGAKTDPIAMFDLIRFPSWMENKEDPFSANLISPVPRSSSLSTDSMPSTSSFSSSSSTADFENSRGLITPATEAITPSKDSSISGTHAGAEDSKADAHGDDKKFNLMTTATFPSSLDASTGSRAVPRSRYKHYSLPADFRFVPITTILLAGGNAMPLLSALTNLPDTPYRLLAHRRPRTSVYDDRTTVISETPSVDARPENATTGCCDLHISSGLSELHIPQSPFDPFGSIGMTSPYLMSNNLGNAGPCRDQRNEQENSPEHKDIGGRSNGTISAEANDPKEGQSLADTVTKPEDSDHCADKKVREENVGAHRCPRLSGPSTIRAKSLGLDASALRKSRTHFPKLLGPSAETRTASHHTSLVDVRPKYLNKAENVTREFRDDDLHPPINSPTRASGNLSNSSSDETHTHAAQYVQGERVPVATLKHAAPVTGCDSSTGLSSEDASEPDGGAVVKGKSSSTKRFRKSMIGKLKKLAHVKSSSSK